MGVIHRHSGPPGAFRWEGVRVERYDDAAVREVTKQVLIGPAEGATRFALRYFEVAPGAVSALDQHHHDHGVLVVKGRGRVRLGDAHETIGVGDVIYVAPDEVHQFESLGPEPLGFLCIVPPKP